MQINEWLAKLLVEAVSKYASQTGTKCSIEECVFEEELIFLFKNAKRRGVDIQDIAVITSITLAVAIMRPDIFQCSERELKLVKA